MNSRGPGAELLLVWGSYCRLSMRTLNGENTMTVDRPSAPLGLAAMANLPRTAETLRPGSSCYGWYSRTERASTTRVRFLLNRERNRAGQCSRPSKPPPRPARHRRGGSSARHSVAASGRRSATARPAAAASARSHRDWDGRSDRRSHPEHDCHFPAGERLPHATKCSGLTVLLEGQLRPIARAAKLRADYRTLASGGYEIGAA